MLTADDAATLERCLAAGGVVLFPADTVYGLACDPEDGAAVRRLYELKGRPPEQPSAVLFFSLEAALGALPDLPPRALAAAEALLPGALTLLLPNAAERFPLACGSDAATLGLRVPAMPPAAEALRAVRRPLLQSSANLHGGPDARRLADVPAALRGAVDLVLDADELPGTPSTVVDLRAFADGGDWAILRHGAVPDDQVGLTLQAL